MHIALVAISGLRPYDQALTDVGRSLIGVQSRWDAIASLPSLALLTLAGMTGKEHEYIYREVDHADKLDTLPGDVDFVALSSYTAKIDLAYAVAAHYRARGVPSVIGGPHVSVLPEEAATHCDAVVVGEGESAWPQVIEDAARGGLRRIYGGLDATFSLRDAPLPAYELLDLSRYNRLPVQTSRGCPHRCEFCASSVLIAGKYKQKPVEKVLAEVDKIKALWPRPFIEFADDNSFVSRRYWKTLLEELRGRKVRWFAQTDLAVSRDDDLLALMRDSGCAQVLIGFESPCAEDLEGLELRNDWKRRHFRDSRDAIRRIQAHGITVLGCFVVGMDTQGPACFDAVYDFARETEMYDVQVTILTPFPGTPLYDRLRREDRLFAEAAWHKCTLYDVNYQPRRMSAAQLEDGFRDLIVRLYRPEETAWRRKCYKRRQRERMRATVTEGSTPASCQEQDTPP